MGVHGWCLGCGGLLGRPLRLAGLAALLLTVLCLGRTAQGADPELARFLLDGGKKEIDKRRFVDAVVKLERARVEDASLIEVVYWLAVAHDKSGAEEPARRAYREFRDACHAARQAGPLDRGVDALLKKAEARLMALSAAETELARLHAPFVASMLATAKAQALRDPAVALRAALAIAAVDPEHPEARRLIERFQAELGRSGASGAPAGTPEPAAKAPPAEASTFVGVKRWQDLLGTRGLGAHEGWTYGPQSLLIDRSQGGAFFWPTTPLAAGSRYVLEMELCLRRADSPRWTLGFGFGRNPAGDHLATFVSGTEIVALQLRGGAPTQFAKPGIVPPVEPDGWHRLAVDVDGAMVKLWFDDRVVVEATLPNVSGLPGACGLYQQSCRCEIRRLRLGTGE